MKQINFLSALPTVIRDPKLLEARRKVKEDGEDFISRMYGREYFDGDRKYGFGGYFYDERWIPVAKRMISHYNLHPGSRILDIGCAKGFLVQEFRNLGMEAFGLDVSRYAVQNCLVDTIGYIHRGDILDLHFNDDSFDLVLCLGVIHNLDEDHLPLAFKEVQRVSKGPCFITVDSYHTKEQEKIFLEWVLTAKSHGYPSWWLDKFKECGYTKDYDWVVWESGYE